MSRFFVIFSIYFMFLSVSQAQFWMRNFLDRGYNRPFSRKVAILDTSNGGAFGARPSTIEVLTEEPLLNDIFGADDDDILARPKRLNYAYQVASNNNRHYRQRPGFSDSVYYRYAPSISYVNDDNDDNEFGFIKLGLD